MLRIYVDERENQSGIPDLLRSYGVAVVLQQLSVGDYILGDGVAVERKSVNDLVNSVFDKRLFDQISRMSQTYALSFLLIEGDLSRIKQITDRWKAINGAIISLIMDYKINVIYSMSKSDTVEILIKIAKKSQEEDRPMRAISLHDKRKLSSIEDFQEYIIESFPNVGSNTAKKIMKKFKSINDFCNASLPELEKALGSKKRAELIFSIIHKNFSISSEGVENSNEKENKHKSLFDFMDSS
jgi:DNA excision repair protein ERCC-4